MFNTQGVYNIGTINNSQQEATILSANPQMILAIGRVIGNTSAHEIAHQFLQACCWMDDDPLNPNSQNPIPSKADPNARGAYNFGGANTAKEDPSFYIGYWQSPVIALHWESDPVGNQVSAYNGLRSCLGTAWHEIDSNNCRYDSIAQATSATPPMLPFGERVTPRLSAYVARISEERESTDAILLYDRIFQSTRSRRNDDSRQPGLEQ
jgi:hypothetical protein